MASTDLIKKQMERQRRSKLALIQRLACPEEVKGYVLAVKAYDIKMSAVERTALLERQKHFGLI